MTRDFILDFDRTLFDTEQFYVHLSDRGLRHLVGGVELFENEIDLTQFIYKDAQRFLSEQPRDRLHVVSAVAIATGDAPCEHQRKMIEWSGVADQVATVELVAGEKGPVLAERPPAVFVDDLLTQVQSVRAAAPQHTVVHIDRRQETTAGDSHATERGLTIASFDELPTVLSL